jgi:hypothetical protein
MAIAMLAFTVSLAGSTTAQADAALQSFLEQVLAWLQHRDHNPAIAALIQIDGKVEAEAAIGYRALGHPESVTVDDRWHIRSVLGEFVARARFWASWHSSCGFWSSGSLREVR